MEAKQLELFKETDFEKMKTFIKEYNGWYLFDNIMDRKDFSRSTSNKYLAVCKISKIGLDLFGGGSLETRVIPGDEEAKLIGMDDYLKLASYIRINGKYVYNKRKGKLELKNGKG